MPQTYMNQESFSLIKDLTELQGISGDEGRVRQYIHNNIKDLVDKVHLSSLGNVFGERFSDQKDAPKLMVAAHMDEVGFMVREITDRGLIKVTPLGGWNPYVISAQRYTLKTRKADYPIVSGAVPPHLLKDSKGKQEIKADNILFDAGFESKEEALEFGVRPGDSIIPQVETVKTANEKAIISKAWDNRYGCAAVIETLRRVKDQSLPQHLIIGASVQEEVGLRGIRGAVHEFKPDLFIAVDASPANDVEKATSSEGELGKGFLLRIQDPGMITHQGMREYIEDTASSNNIPFQYFFSKGGTDAGAAHTMNDGIPSAVVGVPARYIHGHQTLFRIDDYEAAKELLYQIVTKLDKTTYQTITKK